MATRTLGLALSLFWVLGCSSSSETNANDAATEVRAADTSEDGVGGTDLAPELDVTTPDVPLVDLPGDAQADVLPVSDTTPVDVIAPDLTDSWLEDGQSTDIGPTEVAADLPDAAEVTADVAIEEISDISADVPPEEQAFAVPAMSAWVVRKAKFDKPVKVTCTTVSGLGEVIDNPGEYVVTFSADDSQEVTGGYLFPTPGTYEVTCTDEANGLEGTAEFVVAHDMLSPSLTQLSQALTRQSQLLGAALAAVKDDDKAALEPILASFHEHRVRATALVPAVAQTPPEGWPDLATIEAIVDAKPDDAMYENTVVTILASTKQLTKDIASLAAEPTLDHAGTVQATIDYIDNKLVELDSYDPSDRVRYKVRPQWDELMVEIQAGQSAYAVQLAAMLDDYEAWEAEPCPGCFTLGELVVSMAIQYTLSALPSYNKMLVEAGKCAASMAVMLLISDAIDASITGPDAPLIEYNMPGYGNAVNDGSQLSLLVSGFDPEPGNSVVLFISPNIGDAVVNVVDAALATMSAIKSLGNWDNVFELGGAIVDSYNALTGDLALMEEDIPGLMSDGIVPMPVLSTEPFLGPGENYWELLVHLPALPECVDGWLPKIGLLVPISFTRGNGPAYELVILP